MKTLLLSFICLPAICFAQSSTDNSPSELTLIQQKALSATAVTCKLAGEDWAQMVFETQYYKALSDYMSNVNPETFVAQTKAIEDMVLEQPSQNIVTNVRIFRKLITEAKRTECLTFDQSMRLNYLKTIFPLDSIYVESASYKNLR